MLQGLWNHNDKEKSLPLKRGIGLSPMDERRWTNNPILILAGVFAGNPGENEIETALPFHCLHYQTKHTHKKGRNRAIKQHFKLNLINNFYNLSG